MEKANIIEKVTKPTKWVNPMCIVSKKNGKLRICIDPQDLNHAIQREHYPMPKTEEIVSRLGEARYMSVLDANQAFYQVRLDEESSYLCTMNTPYGRYRFLRLPYGIKSASEVFHRLVTQSFENMEGVESFVDDILVWGRDRDEHDRRLADVLEKLRKMNLKLNKDKCRFAVTEVRYLGHVIGNSTVKPDPEKVRAIADMPRPTDKKGVQRFLGLVTYLGKFIPNQAEVTAPLRQLTLQDVPWHWSAAQENAFKSLKKLITRDPVLKIFDPGKPVVISVDSSQSGMGAVLLQEQQPVEYGSRALTPTQQQYAQIEKELLAVTFGLERFHQYAYGRDVVVETDHKPLVSISRKPLSRAPPRVQRLMLRLQRYPGAQIEYRPGKELKIADALSRAYTSDTFDDENLDAQVHAVLSSYSLSDEQIQHIQEETAGDPALQDLRSYIQMGWPDTKSEVPPCLHEYWNCRDELSYFNQIILKGSKLVIPRSMRREMLDRLHMSHLGMEKHKRRARDVMFWPGMNSQIEELVSGCPVCQEFQKSQPKEPMISHEVPSLPWETVGTDLFVYKGRHYLLVVDHYSRYFEIALLRDETSPEVVTHMKSIFARHGIPIKVVSDNGPCYSAREFQSFSEAWGFKHVTVSAKYQQSNALPERFVQTVKKLLYKADKRGQDPYIALLEYRNTPIDQIGSPAQMLMSRRLRSVLPTTKAQLTPKVVNEDLAQQKLAQKHATHKKYYDRSTRIKSQMSEGDPVHVQLHPQSKWTPGVVHSRNQIPRSYNIETPSGVYKRNSRFIRRTPNVRENVKLTEPQNPTPEPQVHPERQAPAGAQVRDRPPDPPVQKTPVKAKPPPKPNPTPPKPAEPTLPSKEPVTSRFGRVIKPKIPFDV